MSQKPQAKSMLMHALPFIIIGLAACFYVYEFMLRVMPSAMEQGLKQDFGLTATGFGLIGSIFYWGYNPLQIPAGLLIDRYSTRTLISIATGLCGVGAIIFGVAPHFFIAGIGRMIIGMTAAFAFISALILTSRWFEAKYFAMITGAVQFMGSVGAMIGVYPIAMVLKHYTWRQTQVTAGIIGLVLSVLMYLIIRDRPQKPINESHHTITHQKISELARLKKVLSHPQTWLVGLFGFCSWAPMTIFSVWWGPAFLTKYYDISISQAGKGIAFIWLGNAIASPLCGWWSNRISSRCTPLSITAILAIATSCTLLYVPNLSWTMMCVVLFLFGAAAGAQPITFGCVQDNMPPQVAGTAVGFNNMAIVMSGVMFTPLVGVIMDFVWDGTLDGNLPLYTLTNYETALVLIPLCGILGLITSIFWIKETHCKVQYDLDFGTGSNGDDSAKASHKAQQI